MMRALVTGGAGFVGSHTVVELLGAGHEAEILDNLSNSQSSVVDRIGEITGIRPPLHVGDIRDPDLVRSVLETGNFDAIFHFAGLKAVGESVERPLTYYENNVVGSTVLLRGAADAGVRRFIFSSSCTVYGDPDTVPVSEGSPRKPATNPYGRTKQVIEDMLSDVAGTEGTWAVGTLRYFNPVGAHPSGLIGEDPRGIPNNLLPYVTQVAAGVLPELSVFGKDYPTRDGTGIRDYIHVVDLAQGHVAALEFIEKRNGVHIWNLGTGSGTTVLELVHAFEEVNGVTVPLRFADRRSGDVAETWADPGKARQELGWVAQRDLGDICRDAWRWQQRQASLG